MELRLQFTMILKQWLHFNQLKGNYHFIALTAVLLFLFINSYNIFILLLLLGLLIYIFLKHKILFIITLVLLLLICFMYISKCLIYNNATLKINKMLIVDKIENEETYQKVILRDGIHKYIYYNKNDKMIVGDVYKITAEVVYDIAEPSQS